MSAEPDRLYTVEEYLEREELATEKSEYYRGRIYPLTRPNAMAGASIRHSIITANLVRHLGNRLAKPCRPYGPDQQIATAPNGLYAYPDTSIILR